jgi:alpha-glucosidase (family GH31 glycosyl hydrolase)
MIYEEPGNAKVRAMSSTYLWGKDFLVTPVLKKGQTKADVYFPARSAWFDFYTGERQAGGATRSIELSPDHVPVYVRAGAFVPKVVQTTRLQHQKHRAALLARCLGARRLRQAV